MTFPMNNSSFGSRFWKSLVPQCTAATLGAVLFALVGCETAPQASSTSVTPRPTSPPDEIQAWQDPGKLTEVQTIREGDSLKIAFPGAPNLTTTQQVRADGVVTLDIVGEVKVVGLSPKELEEKLGQLYATQLVSNEVTVSVVASSFDVFVSGAVLRPGKITTSKPITAFQAVMEAGYDPAVANLQSVTIIREESRSKYIYLTLNLLLVLQGKESRPFYLKPGDTIQVSKRVTIL
jgi:polysaccharide biosynthesis/export protein